MHTLAYDVIIDEKDAKKEYGTMTALNDYLLRGADDDTERWLSSTYVLYALLTDRSVWEVDFDDSLMSAEKTSKGFISRWNRNKVFSLSDDIRFSILTDFASSFHSLLPGMHRLNISLIKEMRYMVRDVLNIPQDSDFRVRVNDGSVVKMSIIDSYGKYILSHTLSCIMKNYDYWVSDEFNAYNQDPMVGMFLSGNSFPKETQVENTGYVVSPPTVRNSEFPSNIDNGYLHITIDMLIDELSFDSFLLSMGYRTDKTEGGLVTHLPEAVYPFSKKDEFQMPHVTAIASLMNRCDMSGAMADGMNRGCTYREAFDEADGYIRRMLTIDNDFEFVGLPPLSMLSLKILSEKPLSRFPNIIVDMLLTDSWRYYGFYIDDYEWLVQVDYNRNVDYYLAYDVIMSLLSAGDYWDSCNRFIDYPSLVAVHRVRGRSNGIVSMLMEASMKTHDEELLRVGMLFSDIVDFIRKNTEKNFVSLRKDQIREMFSSMSAGLPLDFLMETVLSWDDSNQGCRQLSNASEFVLCEPSSGDGSGNAG
jgi:hypothetical protein